MDLGIAGRKAIVCASSKGLGRACARALAEAGCAVVLNGRDAEALARTGRELREATGVQIREILGDLDDPATRAELIAACPDPDILVNNNGGPPFKPFDQITREDVLKGVELNMLTPIALVQALRRAWPNASSAGSSTSPRVRSGRRSPASTSRQARAQA